MKLLPQLVLLLSFVLCHGTKPNIIIILIDDMVRIVNFANLLIIPVTKTPLLQRASTMWAFTALIRFLLRTSMPSPTMGSYWTGIMCRTFAHPRALPCWLESIPYTRVSLRLDWVYTVLVRFKLRMPFRHATLCAASRRALGSPCAGMSHASVLPRGGLRHAADWQVALGFLARGTDAHDARLRSSLWLL